MGTDFRALSRSPFRFAAGVRGKVYPTTRCVWLIAYERAAGHGRLADLNRLQRPIDQRLWGRSAWVNYWLGRDDLWTLADDLEYPVIRGAAPTSMAGRT